MIEFIEKNLKTIISFLMVLLGGLLLLPKFLPLMINADSYAILLPKILMDKTGFLGGQLGMNGDYFFPLFYRGGFSLVILLMSKWCNVSELVMAKGWILAAYVASGVLIFFLLRKIYQSNRVGLAGAAMLYLSYSFRSWSMVTMAEIPTICLILGAITILVYSEKNIGWILSALIMGVAFCFRLEMVVLLLLVGLIYNTMRKNLKELVYYVWISMIVWLGYQLFLYLFSYDANFWLSDQLSKIGLVLEYHELFFAFAICLLGFWLMWKIQPLLTIIPIGLLGYYFWHIGGNWQVNWQPLWMFVWHDLPLMIIFGVSLLLALLRKEKKVLMWLVGILLLVFLYFSRGEYRYYVHVVVLLVVVAAYVWKWLEKKLMINKWLMILWWLLIIVMVSGQLYFDLMEDFLPTIGYEQSVAIKTKEVMENNNIEANVVVCSVFSEAIYYETRHASMDCFDGLKDIMRNNTDKLVVIDEDMARHQPETVEYLEKNGEKIEEEWIMTAYQEKNTKSVPQYPVRWILIKNEG
ncbi:MAG TPA: hypothetical protein PLZ62_00170 [bacterium]|nr:hypothetical protein [bacterium]